MAHSHLREISLFDESLLAQRGFIRTAYSSDKAKRIVHLYELPRAHHAERASNYFHQFCRLILLTEFPGLRLDDVRWTYHNGFLTSNIRFRSFSHGFSLMRLSSTYGLNGAGAHLVDYASGYYNTYGAACPPSSPATYCVLWSEKTGRTAYLTREHGPKVHGYEVKFVNSASYAQMVRSNQPLVFQTVPEQMQAVEEGGDGSRLSQALAMSKIFCRHNYQTNIEEAGIFTNPRASLGLLGHAFPLLPVLAKSGTEAAVLSKLCGIRISRILPERYMNAEQVTRAG